MIFKKRYLFLALLLSQFSFSQEGVAVYSDYLSDNYYLIHPSMAGAANCGKIRLTARQQWMGQEDAPALQTVSFNTALDEDGISGIGMIVFNDKNGYHSQRGAKLTYAHHIRFSRSTVDLNQLSFGLSGAFIQSTIDGKDFTEFDPRIVAGVIQKDAYFNVDIGASYHYMDFFTHLTVKNFLANRRELYSEEIESDNLRKILWSAGAVFGDADRIMFEPSFMFQWIQETKEKSIDLNLKLYKNLDFGRIWGGLSYRRSFDEAEYTSNGISIERQRMQYLTPIVGVNYKKFMVAYTYSHLLGDVRFDNGGFHQITLGFDIFCKDNAWDCNCPAVN